MDPLLTAGLEGRHSLWDLQTIAERMYKREFHDMPPIENVLFMFFFWG
jgi:hypothetical protein